MFEKILSDMVGSIDGALGALFLDYQGEAVQVVGKTLPSFDLQVIGAYQGIFVSQLERICRETRIGALERFKIDWGGSKLLSSAVQDGYFVVLVLRGESIESLAWHQLNRCRERLLQEM